MRFTAVVLSVEVLSDDRGLMTLQSIAPNGRVSVLSVSTSAKETKKWWPGDRCLVSLSPEKAEGPRPAEDAAHDE